MTILRSTCYHVRLFALKSLPGPMSNRNTQMVHRSALTALLPLLAFRAQIAGGLVPAAGGDSNIFRET
jgi:hypothetical protein